MLCVEQTEHAVEMTQLRQQLMELEQELEEVRAGGLGLISEDVELRLKSLVRDWERKLAQKDTQHSEVRVT